MSAATRIRVRRMATVALALLFCLASMGAMAGAKKKKVAKKKKGPPPVTVVGTVEAKTGKKGKLVSVAVKSDDGKEYLVVLNRLGKKLAKDATGKKVEATGKTFTKGKKANVKTWFNVTNFALKEAAPAPDDEPLPEGDDMPEDAE